jgi:AraC-like DNA-binding protein
MSLTAFHKHFKNMTSLTPGQFQKRLRLIEARRLMLDEGLSATGAAFEVGYESVSQFTREYSRMFQMPPKRDALRAREGVTNVKGRAQENRRASAG